MEDIDFVIQYTLTYNFYSWENDWYLVNVNKAKGFSTEDRRAWEVIQMHNLQHVTVKKADYSHNIRDYLMLLEDKNGMPIMEGSYVLMF